MADIISNITLCDVPITPMHELSFADRQEQTNYFQSHKVFEYLNCKYIPRTGTIRVKGYVDSLINCNYGYYTNTYNGTTKTFYFFIVQKNLIAKQTTELVIQLDVWQTWLFEMRLNECFIERAHVHEDEIGQHTIPEDFELGEYITRQIDDVKSLQGELAYFVAITDASNSLIGGHYGKIYAGYRLIYYDFAHLNNLTTYIQQKCNDGKADSIAFIFTYPKQFLNDLGFTLSSGTTLASRDLDGLLVYAPAMLKTFAFRSEQYIPRNNKLLTYPFNMLEVQDGSGNEIILKYENFDEPTNAQQFILYSVLTQNPTFSLVPSKYAGRGLDLQNSIETQGFPLCSWNNDNYANWYANNSNSIKTASQNAQIVKRNDKRIAKNTYENSIENAKISKEMAQYDTVANTIGSLLSLKLGGAVQNAVTGSINMLGNYKMATNTANTDLENAGIQQNTNYLTTIGTITASVRDAMVQPNSAKGDTSASGLDVARNTNTFYFVQKMIKPEFAKIIDNYFQMYGYQLNIIGKPSYYINTRLGWNFIKTVNATVSGNVPQEDKKAIEDLLNNGFTIWHETDKMYLYDRNNAINPVVIS